MSPHTPNEKFEGATVLKTLQVHPAPKRTTRNNDGVASPSDRLLCGFLQYGYEGRVPMSSARLFYDISERARRIIESYFLLNSTLHFSYTHLVCRTAITGNAPDTDAVFRRVRKRKGSISRGSGAVDSSDCVASITDSLFTV